MSNKTCGNSKLIDDFLHILPENSNLANSSIRCFRCESTDSTNRLAHELCKTEALPFLVLSDSQTNGRGCGDKTFYSPAGGIYMSVALDAAILPENPTIAVSVCVAQAIEQVCGVYPKLKWVNDILFNNKKICGILCECVTLECGKVYICGIGVNCKKTEVPQSLSNIVGFLDLNDCERQALIRQIAQNLLVIGKSNRFDVMAEYRKRSMMTGRTVSYDCGGIKLRGVVQGIDDDGALLVQVNDDVKRITCGSVSVEGLYD